MKLAVISGLAACLLSTSVLAFEMSAPDGWYLEGNIGASRLSNTNYSGSANNSGAAYNGNLGYKFMPYVAVEGGYTSYNQSKIRFNGMDIANVSHYSYDIAAKGIWPISDCGFEIFGKLGAAHMRTKVSSVDTAIVSFTDSANATNYYVGLGAQVNVMSELGIVAQWQRAQGSNSTGAEDFYSIGLAFIFV